MLQASNDYHYSFFCYEIASQTALGRGSIVKTCEKLKLAAEIRLIKYYLMISSTWLINVYIHLDTRNRF